MATRGWLVALGVWCCAAFLGDLCGQQGVTTGGKAWHAKNITITGEVDTGWFFRDDSVMNVLDREDPGNATANFLGALIDPDLTASEETDDEAAMYANFRLRVEATLAEQVKGVVEARVFPIDSDFADSFGSGANSGILGGGGGEFDVQLGDAYIDVKEILSESYSFRIGLQNYTTDLRGTGRSFFMDIRNAELAFANGTIEAWGLGTIYAGDELLGGIIAPNAGEIYRGRNNGAGGLKLTYALPPKAEKTRLWVDLFWFNVRETRTLHDDETAYGTVITYLLPGERNKLILPLTVFENGNNNQLLTAGLGFDYWGGLIGKPVELYGEFYGQVGEYGNEANGAGAPGVNTFAFDGADLPNDGVAEAHRDEIDQQAWAGVMGARMAFEEYPCKPWVDLSVTHVSGDDGDQTKDNEDFVSYESIGDTLILEDSLWGLDVDTNYVATKLQVGAVQGIQRADDFKIKWVSGLFRMAEKVDYGNPAINVHRDLGWENDLELHWDYTDALSFTLTAATLFGGKFWADGEEPDDAGFNSGDEEMWMMVFETKLTF